MNTLAVAVVGAAVMLAGSPAATPGNGARSGGLKVSAEISSESTVVGAGPDIYLTFENIGDVFIDVPLPYLYSITCWASPCLVGDIFVVNDGNDLAAMGYLDRSHECIRLKERERKHLVRLFPGESVRVHLNARAKRFPGPGGRFVAPGRYRLVARYVHEPPAREGVCPRLMKRDHLPDEKIWSGAVEIEPVEFMVRPAAVHK